MIERGHAGPRRRGVMLVVVMGLLALVLAAAYAMTRSQFTSASLQSNNQRTGIAREAAATGLAIALRKMHETGWTIDDVVTGSVSSQATYSVTFTTGDPRLAANDADYAQYPYRVTVVSRGIAADLGNTGMSTERKARAIVELIPRQMGITSAAWQAAQQYTVYQYKNATAEIHSPARIEGKSFFQGNPRLGRDYPADAPRTAYLAGLNTLRKNGQPDYRPLSGPIVVPLSRVDAANLSLLQSSLELTVTDTASNTTAPVTHPGALSTYKLYTGGKSYTVPTLPATIAGTTYQADPLTNPIGVFQRTGALQLGNGATIRGLVVMSSDGSNLDITGTGVSLEPTTLPAVEGNTNKTQLPVLLVKDDIVLGASGRGTIRGLVVVWDQFETERLNSGAGLDFTGRLIAGDLDLEGVQGWTSSSINWGNDLILYNLLVSSNSTSALFPIYMQALRTLDPKPVLTVKPDASDVKYHWQNWANPIFVKHADDPGLRWRLLVWNDPWEENP